MKNKILMFSTLGVLSVAPVFAIVSCGSNTKNRVGTYEEKFNVEVNYTNGLTKSGELPSKVNVYQAEANKNALDRVEIIKKNLTVKQLQFDFDIVLQDFYEAYEAETSLYEIEIESIKVADKNDDGSFNLDVKYEIEANDKRDKEQILTKTIKWTPTMKLISKDDIEKIKNDIVKLSEKNNSGFDIKDIKELFLGEKDDNDIDDIGIFDKIALINKDYNGLAYLLAYEISIDDIFSQLSPSRKGITTKTKFLVPSLSLNSNATVFVPGSQPEMDYSQKSLSTSELNVIFGTESTPKIITSSDSNQQIFVDTLNKLFTKTYTIEELVGSKQISRMILINPNSNNTSLTTKEYQVVIEFANSKKAPDMVVFFANDVNQNAY
ncbi:hypothetical protein ACJA28_00270 [Mesomycoplasma moatsii]|uniref:hypothetical protein n=1 Tax=Mesomycoplasma moatsii TaxID=171287 RepID=UPI0003B69617